MLPLERRGLITIQPVKQLRFRYWVVPVALLAWAPPAFAHVFTIINALTVLKSDGTFQIDMTVDVDALALGVPSTTDSALVANALRELKPDELELAIQQARETMIRRTDIRFDGQKIIPQISFPQHGATPDDAANPTVLGIIARLEGKIPDGAKEFTFAASRAWAAVDLTVLDQGTLRGVRYPLGAGETSSPYVLGAKSDDRPESTAGSHLVRYVLIGYEHIIPQGLDHVFFVLGLFLLSTRLKPLLWQVTAFTVAHSVTLALAIYGIVKLSPGIVEPLIALSIAYVAVENIITSELKPWRPVVVFLFGLLHGMGFAGALSVINLPRDDFAKGVVLFNVGVELGQLSVIAAAFLIVGWFRKRPWYRKVIVIPLSCVIALTGIYWAIIRTLG